MHKIYFRTENTKPVSSGPEAGGLLKIKDLNRTIES